jgi:hypothetical protein
MCRNDFDCAGSRTCSFTGLCKGEARPATVSSKTINASKASTSDPLCPVPTTTKGPCYVHDESKNMLGKNKCSNDFDCSGARTCSSYGWCSGEARPATVSSNTTNASKASTSDPLCPVPTATKGPCYVHDESKNKLGKNKCSNDFDCSGARTCSSYGWCSGEARPARLL